MMPKPEDSAAAAAPRPSMDFVGLAAALAFIAVGPSAAAVTERSADQFREVTGSSEASLVSSSIGADAGNDGGFRLAQSTQCANPGSPDCDDEDGYDDYDNSGGEDQLDPFQFDYLPSEHGWFDGVDIQEGYWYQVQLENFNEQSGPPYVPRMTTGIFGPKGTGLPCLGRGGAIMFSVKARKLGCWAPAKAPPVRGLRAPRLDQAAQRVLARCRIATGSVTIRNGAFACIATPRAVVRKAAKGAPVRRAPARSSQG